MLPGRQGDAGDRRRSAASARRGLASPEPAHGVPRRRLDARLRRADRRRDRAARSASSRRSATSASGTTWSTAMGGRARAASTSSPSTAARAAPARRRWSSPTTSRCRSGSASPASTRKFAAAGLTDDVDVHRRGQARRARERRRRVRARRRHGQRRPRGDDVRSAASRPRSATPTTARPAWRRRTRGCVRGLDPELKSVRAANYVKSMRRDLWKVSEAMGVVHPGLMTPDDVDILDGLERAPDAARGLPVRRLVGPAGDRPRAAGGRVDGQRGAARAARPPGPEPRRGQCIDDDPERVATAL